MDLESENFLVASAVRASDGHHGHSSGRGDGADNLVYALRADASRDGQALTPSVDAEGNVRLRDPGFNVYDDAPTLDSTAPPSVGPVAGLYVHRGQANDTAYTPDGTPPLMSSARNTPGAQIGMGVRRLTPLECERLMGWPDEWTRYTSDGQEISDSHRYRMCGNGIIATMAEWLGHRLIMADSLEKVLQSDSA
jgi:DNA (cytosine-5)-methyltransferase 1